MLTWPAGAAGAASFYWGLKSSNVLMVVFGSVSLEAPDIYIAIIIQTITARLGALPELG
jgi:hypothetical protein